MSKDTYPEHLNPFYEGEKKKSSLSLSNSFRGFTKTLRKSFRIRKREKNDEVEIRPKTNNSPIKIVSCPSENEFYTPLPRSRFQERLAKTDEIHHRASLDLNPFENKTRRKRRKKPRAPLPPSTSISNQNISDGIYNNNNNYNSKWSLTSADTEYSYATDISGGLECHHLNDEEEEIMKEKFEHFNDEMKKLNEDESNSNHSNDDTNNNNNNVPDLVVSCPSQDQDLENNNINNNNSAVIDEIIEKDERIKEEETNNDLNDNNKIVITKDINQNPKLNDENEVFLYYERKSIYILGSTDELNKSYIERCSLYINGSTEELDNIDDNKGKTSPIKQRKNLLNKEDLLGTSQ